MAEKQIRQQQQEHQQKKEQHQDDGRHHDKSQHKKEQKSGHAGGMHMMGKDQRKEMLHMHHIQTIWIYWLLVMLGIWLVVSPLTFSYAKGTVEPSGGRDLWLSLEQRILFMKWSDIISGVLLIFFGWRSLTPNRPVSLWICCFIGIWLSIAPVWFWSPTAAGYLNNTLVGMLVISLTILIPGMPNMIMYMKMGSEVPQG